MRTTDTEIKQQSMVLLPVNNSLQIQVSSSGDKYNILSAQLYSQDTHRAGYQLVFNFPIADEPSKMKARAKFIFVFFIVTRKLV